MKNIKYFFYPRYFHNCSTEMNYKEVEEERPLCKVEMMNMNHTTCQEEDDSGVDKSGDTCKKVMKCEIGMKKIRKTDPRTECRDVAVGEEEKCVEVVKLEKEQHEGEHCSFHPKTVCRQAEDHGCRKVRKKMCNYVHQVE